MAEDKKIISNPYVMLLAMIVATSILMGPCVYFFARKPVEEVRREVAGIKATMATKADLVAFKKELMEQFSKAVTAPTEAAASTKKPKTLLECILAIDRGEFKDSDRESCCDKLKKFFPVRNYGLCNASPDAATRWLYSTTRGTTPPLPATVTGVTVTPATASLRVGDTQSLAGSTTPIAAPVNWTADNPAVCAVSGTGVVTGVGAGTCIVTATSGTAHGEAIITVAAAPITAEPVTGGGWVFDCDARACRRGDEVIYKSAVTADTMWCLTSLNTSCSEE